jgi:ubiquinone/menaquinone biosynthesis C-methylase UbiE
MNLREKWDRASRTYNFVTFGEDLRQGDAKRRLFDLARGRTIFVAVGTGNDIKFLPAGLDVVALDVSSAMLEKARVKADGPDNAGLPARPALRPFRARLASSCNP